MPPIPATFPRSEKSELLSKRGIASGVNGSVSETAPRPVVPPRQGDRIMSRSFGSSRTRSRTTLTVSPDELGTDTLVIVG